MSRDFAALNGSDEKPKVCSAVAPAELKLIREELHTLPAPAIKDLLSIGACSRCIFRLFGVFDYICSFPTLPVSSLNAILGEVLELQGDEKDNICREDEDLSGQQPSQPSVLEPKVCTICLGILDLVYRNEEGFLVQKDCTSEFVHMIANAVKQEHGEIDGFSLEVSMPPVVMRNEQLAGMYMKKIYGSENWFQGKSISGCISIKDALKSAIAAPLETFLGIKSNLSTFRLRLMYEISEDSTEKQDVEEINGCKRRKTGANNGVERIRVLETSGTNCSTNSGSDHCELTKCFAKELEGPGSDCLKLLLEKDNRPVCLKFLCYRCPIYIGGRYLKYSRNVSQTCWIIEDERKGEASVEEIIGGNILPLCEGDSYKFHAAGREDIDVRMLGSGRPFLVEIQNARRVLSEAIIKETETKINSLDHNLVRVKNLKIVDSQGWALMREGEAEKQKQYAALVWISRPLKDDDMHTISSIKDMQILQKTPVRVLHRRSPLAREKIIHWMKMERIDGSCQYFLLHLCTQAGTYIKEFVHGDLGRTHPSIGSILGCRAEILQLDVTDVKMDCF